MTSTPGPISSVLQRKRTSGAQRGWSGPNATQRGSGRGFVLSSSVIVDRCLSGISISPFLVAFF